MLYNYAYTVKKTFSIDDAMSFLICILMTDYGELAADEAEWKGFKHRLPTIDCTDSVKNRNLYMDLFTHDRFKKMHLASPIEYCWSGQDKDGFSEYTFWGVTAYPPIRAVQPKPEGI